MPVLPGGRVLVKAMSDQVLDQSTALLEQFANREYEHGWSTDIESDTFPIGLNEDVVRAISAKKGEPGWLLDWRLKAYRHLLTLKEPTWPNVEYKPVDLQSISYYSAPKKKPVLNSLDEADPELLRTFEKLGIPVSEQKVLLNVKGAAASAADAGPDTRPPAHTSAPPPPPRARPPRERAEGPPDREGCRRQRRRRPPADHRPPERRRPPGAG